MTATNSPSTWIPAISKELKIDSMGIKLAAVTTAKRLGIDWATMTDEQSETIKEAVRSKFLAIKAQIKAARRAK